MTTLSEADGARRIASLPMYDFPHLRDAHDILWSAVTDRLISLGVTRVPLHLTAGLDHEELTREPRLLLGQTCEYPLAISGASTVRLVGTPRYTAPGCSGSHYCSFIVVRRDEAVDSVAGLRGKRCAVNEPNSNSGVNLLRAAIAGVSGGQPIFHSVVVSGSHRRSVFMITREEADIAAVDCVSFAHLAYLYPEEMSGLRVLAKTPSSPSLPFISSSHNDAGTVVALRRALAEVICEPDLAHVREELLLDSIDFDPDPEFTTVRRLAREAADVGYPVLR